MSKVVHLSNDAHAAAKAYCKENGLKMSDWVASLITKAMSAVQDPEPMPVPTAMPIPNMAAPPLSIQPLPIAAAVAQHQAQAKAFAATEQADTPPGIKKKRLDRFDEDSDSGDQLPAYARPPFWVQTPTAPDESLTTEEDSHQEVASLVQAWGTPNNGAEDS